MTGRYVPPKRPPLPTAAEREAALQAEQTKVATDAAIKELGRFLGPKRDRTINSLRREEVECVAVAAIGAYVLTRGKQEAAERLNDPIDDIGREVAFLQ